MKKRQIPHTYVIVFAIAVIVAVMTWIVPAGEYNRVEQSGQTVIVPDSYHRVEQSPQTWQLFSSFFQGFVKQSKIVMFILLIGGAFWILNASKSIDAGIMSFINFTKRLEKKKMFRKIGVNNVVMILIMLIFSIFGSVFGMSEETIPFIIIIVPLAISMGYDSITGLCLVYVAAHIGFAGATLNPFTIGIAQQISGLQMFSGIEYRIFCWLIINIVGFAIILWWANKVKKNPKASPMYQLDEYWRKNHDAKTMNIEYKRTKSSWFSFAVVLTTLIVCSVLYPMSEINIMNQILNIPAIPIGTILFAALAIPGLLKSFHFYNLSLLFATIWFLIVGVMGYHWYVIEIGTLFFAMGLMAGVASGNTPNEITKLLLEGMKDILSAAMVVGLAGGIIVLLENGKIQDTIMFELARMMNEMHKTASLGVMYFIQTVLNIIIPSSSAKATLTMPIMAPFSDLIGVSRQAMVMAFQLGDGFTNMFTPTSGVLIGCLGMAKVPFEIWFKWIWKIMLVFIILGFLLLIPTVYLELNGF
jgi:uncharacterized ion transporter superfamily protein YfcC